MHVMKSSPADEAHVDLDRAPLRGASGHRVSTRLLTVPGVRLAFELAYMNIPWHHACPKRPALLRPGAAICLGSEVHQHLV